MSDLPEHVAYALARRERLDAIAGLIEVEAALRDGAAFRMVIDAMAEDAKNATTDLISVNPSDIGMIAALQAQIRASRQISGVLQSIIDRGTHAEMSLKNEADIEVGARERDD